MATPTRPTAVSKTGAPSSLGRVVLLLVEARVLGDVHHPRPAEERPSRVDDRRAVVRGVAVALEQIHDDHDAELAGERGEHARSSAPARARRAHRTSPSPAARG